MIDAHPGRGAAGVGTAVVGDVVGTCNIHPEAYSDLTALLQAFNAAEVDKHSPSVSDEPHLEPI